MINVMEPITDMKASRTVTGRTARCRCKFRSLQYQQAAAGFHCNSTAFELNNGINHGPTAK